MIVIYSIYSGKKLQIKEYDDIAYAAVSLLMDGNATSFFLMQIFQQVCTSHKHGNDFSRPCGTSHVHCIAPASNLFFDQLLKSENIFILEAKACCTLLLLKVILDRYKNSRSTVRYRLIHCRSACKRYHEIGSVDYIMHIVNKAKVAILF